MKLTNKEVEVLFEMTKCDNVGTKAQELGLAGNTFKQKKAVNLELKTIRIKDNLMLRLWKNTLKKVESCKNTTQSVYTEKADWKNFNIEVKEKYISLEKKIKAYNILKGKWKDYLNQYTDGVKVVSDFATNEELVLVMEVSKTKKKFIIKLPLLIGSNGFFIKNKTLYVAKWKLNETKYAINKTVELIHPYAQIIEKVFDENLKEVLEKLELKKITNPPFIQREINDLLLHKQQHKSYQAIAEYLDHNLSEYALKNKEDMIMIENIVETIPGIALLSSSNNNPYKTNKLSKNSKIIFDKENLSFGIKVGSKDVYDTYMCEMQRENIFEIKSSGKRNNNTIKATYELENSKYQANFRCKRK